MTAESSLARVIVAILAWKDWDCLYLLTISLSCPFLGLLGSLLHLTVSITLVDLSFQEKLLVNLRGRLQYASSGGDKVMVEKGIV